MPWSHSGKAKRYFFLQKDTMQKTQFDPSCLSYIVWRFYDILCNTLLP